MPGKRSEKTRAVRVGAGFYSCVRFAGESSRGIQCRTQIISSTRWRARIQAWVQSPSPSLSNKTCPVQWRHHLVEPAESVWGLRTPYLTSLHTHRPKTKMLTLIVQEIVIKILKRFGILMTIFYTTNFFTTEVSHAYLTMVENNE